MNWLKTCLASMLAVFFMAASAVGAESYGRFQFDESERDHWAFRPVERPEVPQPHHASLVRTPVDAFVLAELESQKLEPAPTADPCALLRRVYLDLIGLPPTPAEQDEFLADPSPQRYAAVVDALLARPEYGERWGRHWLDVVRYAESNGYERDNPKPHAWRYRDYVIAAFNDDKPFDQFVVEQLAGDEIDDSNADSQIATTYLRLGPWDDEPADPMVDRYDQLDDVVGTTTATFLAITLRCARCHDHKFEPFTQRDYSRLLAVFEPLKRPQNGREDLDRHVGRPEELAQYRAAIAQADAVVQEQSARRATIEQQVRDRLFGEGRTSLSPDAVSAFQTATQDRNESQKKLVDENAAKLAAEISAACSPDERTQMEQCAAEILAANSHRPMEPPRGYIWFEESTQAPAAHVFYRGDPRSPREEVPPGLPAVLVDAAPAEPLPTASSTGRRLQLAHWIASADNPLTARVMVNRIWQGHFGEGICATENDFGVMGDAPSHPALLDWLASEFVSSGWDVRHLVRLIVTSATYRQSSQMLGDDWSHDPENRLLARGPRLRLQAEFIRDQALAVSGLLNRQIGGASVSPYQPAGLWEELASREDGANWTAQTYTQSHGADLYRRTMYTYWKRTSPPPTLVTFDAPDRETCTVRRARTNTPLQALVLMNDPTYVEASRKLAERIMTEAPAGVSARVNWAFRQVLGRQPTARQSQVLERLFAEQLAKYQADRAAAEQLLAVGEAPRNTELDAAELAAWSIASSVLLNLDETVTKE